MNIGLKLVLFTVFVVIYCEFLVYYVVIYQCNWPEIHDNTKESNDPRPVKALFLGDPHLLGSRKGHWLDKLRREYQMSRSYQALMHVLHPDVVFILGDVFDEGSFCSGDEFRAYYQRYKKIFKTPRTIQLHAVPGNHDIGFHYATTPYLLRRFDESLNTTGARMVEVGGVQFLLVNSMALEKDGCFMCQLTEVQLYNLEKRLVCTRDKTACRGGTKPFKADMRPVLLQHFPMYRESDSKYCSGPTEDLASEPEWSRYFKPKWDCLSRATSTGLMQRFRPRLVVGGHTHSYCYRKHTIAGVTEEYSVPSFSCRNRDNPSVLLATLTPEDYKIVSCYMPRESTVILLYVASVLGAGLYVTLGRLRAVRRFFSRKWKII